MPVFRLSKALLIFLLVLSSFFSSNIWAEPRFEPLLGLEPAVFAKPSVERLAPSATWAEPRAAHAGTRLEVASFETDANFSASQPNPIIDSLKNLGDFLPKPGSDPLKDLGDILPPGFDSLKSLGDFLPKPGSDPLKDLGDILPPGLDSLKNLGDLLPKPGSDPLKDLGDILPPGSNPLENLGNLFPNKDQLEAWWREVEAEVKEQFERFDEYLEKTRILTIGQMQTLPIGLQKKIGKTTCDLLVTEAVFGVDYTSISLVLRLTMPSNSTGDTKLYFGAQDIRISANGGFLEGDVKLALLSDVEFGGKTNALKIRFNSAAKSGQLPPTYAIWNCDGFKELNINANLQISQEYAQSLNSEGEPSGNGLEIDFYCKAESLDRIIANINIPKFAITALEDFKMQVKSAVLDFSSQENAPKMNYSKMPGVRLYDACPEMWTGVYIEELEIELPEYIKSSSTGKSPTVVAKDVFFDERGFCADINMENVLSYNDGKISDWAFSVAKIDLRLVENKLEKAKMEGVIGIPISNQSQFEYTANIDMAGSWDFRVNLDRKVKFELWNATSVEIYKTSHIKMERKSSKQVKLYASLSGKMNIDPMAKENIKEGNFSLGDIHFYSLCVKTEAPYLSCDKFEWKGNASFSNFPLEVNKIALNLKDIKNSLDIGTKLKMFDIGEASVQGDMGISLNFLREKIEDAMGKSSFKWKGDGVHIDKIGLEFENSVFTIGGKLELFKNDKLYGNGFDGQVKFKIKEGLQFGIDARAMFGAMPEFRYWYVDIMTEFGGAGIPIFPGGQISGIGGGAYQRMNVSNSTVKKTDRQTATGLVYVPDSTVGLGIKAFCQLSTIGNPDLFNADLGLEMSFTSSGGLDKISLNGTGKFMAKVDMSKVADVSAKISKAFRKNSDADLERERVNSANDATISAVSRICYDHQNKCFFGSFDAYMDMGVIRGAGRNGNVGLCEMYFAQDDWYINIGHPDKRLGVTLDLGLVSATTNCYFVTGKTLPAMPKIPEKIRRVLSTADYGKIPEKRQVTDIAGGKGFAFGADLSVSTGDLEFWKLYAKFEAQIGFDIMMKKYNGAFCKGSDKPLGVNGWYATGQAYTYLYGDVGIKIKLGKKPRNFTVLQGEVASLLQAQLPNPSYFSGAFGVRYSVLGGLFKGNCNFEFSIGEKCEIVQSGFAEAEEIISDIKPSDKAKEVNVFSYPQVAFNMPINKEISTVFDGEESYIKFVVDKCEVRGPKGNITGKLEWEQDGKHAILKLHEAYPSLSKCSIVVELSAKEKVKGKWQDLKTMDGVVYRESKKYEFETAKMPDTIPTTNISSMYPVFDQKYFYKGEFEKGYIELKRDQGELIADTQFLKRLYYVDVYGLDTIKTAFTYNRSDKKLNFSIPKNLKNQTEYELLVVLENKNKKEGNVGIDVTEEVMEGSQEYGEFTKQKTSLKSDALNASGFKILTRIKFSTSVYNTLREKMLAINLSEYYHTPLLYKDPETDIRTPDPEVELLDARMIALEGFDDIEIDGNEYTNGPLIEARANLSNDKYYNNTIYPLVYKNYPYDNAVSFSREAGQDIIPTWAINRQPFYKESDKATFPWSYFLSYQYYQDFDMVLRGIANRGSSSNYKSWLTKNFVIIPYGTYPIDFKYRLPNGEYGTSVSKFLKK